MEGGTKPGLELGLDTSDVKQFFTRFTKSDAVRPEETLTVSVSLRKRKFKSKIPALSF